MDATVKVQLVIHWHVLKSVNIFHKSQFILEQCITGLSGILDWNRLHFAVPIHIQICVFNWSLTYIIEQSQANKFLH